MNDITQFLTGYGGPVLFAVVFAEQAGLPLPAAPWLLAAGALSASGKLNPALAVGLTALAAVIADSLWFYVGRRGGQRVMRLFCRVSLSRNSCVGRTKGLLASHGLQALVAAKFLPGLGTVMPPLAGALGMSTSRFLLYDGLGSLIYGTFYIAAGFLFRDQLRQAMGVLSHLGFSALLLVLVVVTGYVAFKYARRLMSRKNSVGRGDEAEAASTAEAEATVDEPSAIMGGADLSPASFPRQSLNSIDIPNVALAAITSASQPQPEGVAQQQSCILCNL
jgi:membrane protein DedA with SNARE-associated domain